MPNYVPYHVHSDLSNGVTNIDSVTKYTDYIARAQECGMDALGFSEHGSVYVWYHKKCAIEKAGMKYLHAAEVYVTENTVDQDLTERVRDSYHCVLIAKNWEGVKEINRLVSGAFDRTSIHFYYVPRITMDELMNTSDNVIVTSACIGGAFAKAPPETKGKLLNWYLQHKDRCFLEIQHHLDMQQYDYNQWLVGMAQQYGIRLVAATDTHCLNEQHREGRSILQRSKNINFPNESAWDLTFKTYDELCDAFDKQGAVSREIYLQAIDNTNLIASMVEPFEVDTHSKYPHISDNPDVALREKVERAIMTHPYALKRYSKEEIMQTVDTELDAYAKTGASDFILFQSQLRDWEKTNGIDCGYGRGSVSGSFVAYLLGITEMDSKRFDLNFFRFINPDRVTNADIDTDYSGEDRTKVKAFLLRDKMGMDTFQTSEIITFNTIATKGAILDVCRALEIPLADARKMSASVQVAVDENGHKTERIPEDVRKKYPEVFKYVDIITGTVVSVGTHPSGVLVTDHDIASEIGTCSISSTPYPVSELNMKELDAMMFTKLDILGLDGVGLINATCDLAGIERKTPDNTDLEDMDVWRSIRNDTTAIFQWESNSAQTFLRKFMSDTTIEKVRQKIPNFSMLKWLSFGNGLIRPACASFRDSVADGEFYDNGFKELNDFLAPEMGHVCMQETIMQFLVKFCGYSNAESDTVRRCVADDTLILMGDGTLKRIDQISEGDFVLAKNEFNSFVPRKVNRVFDNGVSNVIYHIKTQNGKEIDATGDHKFLTQDGWKRVYELTGRDFLMTPTSIQPMADGRRPNQRLSEKEMYMYGLLIGDGYLDTAYPTFVNHEIALIEKYKECVNSLLCNGGECQFKVNEVPGKGVDYIRTVTVTSQNYRESLVRRLKKYGLSCKSAQKRIPTEWLSYPARGKLANLLAGLFNTDGGYNKQRCIIEYSTKSKDLAIDVQAALLKFGISSNVRSTYVRSYGCYSYRTEIAGKEALRKFRFKILPLIIGEKRLQFDAICERSDNNSLSYNYMLPETQASEIKGAFKCSGISMNSVGADIGYDDSSFKVAFDKITDTKASEIVKRIYCPKAYELITASYKPVKIISVKAEGRQTHVYDLEVDDLHNYVGNGLVCHNCIAKKKGTEQLLPEIEQRFIEYSSTHYDITAEECAKVIKPFLKVLLDASAYAFSWNHSDAYSAVGYICGWLREYYPYEFITSALNIWRDNDDKTRAIVEYANSKRISITSPKFGISGVEYDFSREQQTIAKGLGSVKFMSDAAIRELSELYANEYKTFSELLYDIKQQTSLNTRQIEILMKIDFFSQFGNYPTVSRIYDVFTNLLKWGEAKSMSKSTMPSELVQIFAASDAVSDIGANGDTLKMYRIKDAMNLAKTIEKAIRDADFQDVSLLTRMEFSKEAYGYVDVITNKPEDRRKLIVNSVTPMRNGNDKPWGYRVETKSLGTGKSARVTIRAKAFDAEPIEDGYVIYVEDIWKNAKGYWEITKYRRVI